MKALMRRMTRYDRMAEDIYKCLRGQERDEAMSELDQMLEIDQKLRSKIRQGKYELNKLKKTNSIL